MKTVEDARNELRSRWGFDEFLPDQEDAVEAVLQGRDALVVLPTGGGKSVTYQLPAVTMGGLAVVVSPLLALMKDQIAALRAMGIVATSLDSTRTEEQTTRIIAGLRSGAVQLLYLSPERLMRKDTLGLIESLAPRFFAIDEAHCLSQWGHDFRREYRELGELRQRFPATPILACTATATIEVRSEIVQTLGLRDPALIVGNFDRPNLTYRARRRVNLIQQLEEVLERHRGEAGIVYCIRRKDVDELTAVLADRGHRVRPYHAGLTMPAREENQRLFSNEEIDIMVATVAFGMGVDRSNVRFVAHTGIPKSLEHYQQEAGRAGRDGLPAECILFYTGGDLRAWREMLPSPGNDHDRAVLGKLESMYDYCASMRCRHAALVEAFGQTFEKTSCDGCDVCLGEHELVPDATVLARKILSCVARLKEGFGAAQVVAVLQGSRRAKVLACGHDRLSTFGILSDHPRPSLYEYIEQLICQDYLVRRQEHGTLGLTPTGRELMLHGGDIKLVRAEQVTSGKATASMSDAELSLRTALSDLRRNIAVQEAVPPFVVFGDRTLAALTLQRPSTPEAIGRVEGMGEAKTRAYGDRILTVIRERSEALGLRLSNDVVRMMPKARRVTPERLAAFECFKQGGSVEEAAQRTGRAISTCENYLAEYLQESRATHCRPWISDEECEKIVKAAARVQAEKLGSVFEALGGRVPYGHIRVALAVRSNLLNAA